MEIVINGTSDLVETDDDVTMEQLFVYIRDELLKQRMVTRRYVLDGEEIDIFEVGEELLAKHPPAFDKLEVYADSVEQVAFDIMNEFIDKVPLLSDDAVSITESFQAGDSKTARDKLISFLSQTIEVVNGLSSVSTLVGYNPEESADNITTTIETLNAHLKELGEAVAQNDLTTIGDVLEFDVSPAIKNLHPMMTELRDEVSKLVSTEGGEQAS